MAVKKAEKKPTEYVVWRGEDADGPWETVGNYSAFGQTAAKKAAAAVLGEDAEAWYFVAVPASSFYPQKPVVQMTITFLSPEGTEEEPEEEPEDEPEDPADDDDAPVEEPEDDGSLPFGEVER